MLDEKQDNVATDSGLPQAHGPLEELKAAVDDALKAAVSAAETFFQCHGRGVRCMCCGHGAAPTATDERDTLMRVYKQFQTENLVHLENEEAVMMPQVMELEKAGANMKQLMNENVWPAVQPAEEKFFITYALKTLEKHSEGKPRAQVFAHAVYAVSSAEEWLRRRMYAKEALSPTLFEEIDALCQEVSA